MAEKHDFPPWKVESGVQKHHSCRPEAKLFYVTLLIVDIGINDIENTTARHNTAFFSSIKTIKHFFTKQTRKKNESNRRNLHQLVIITKGTEKAGKKCFLHKLELY